MVRLWIGLSEDLLRAGCGNGLMAIGGDASPGLAGMRARSPVGRQTASAAKADTLPHCWLPAQLGSIDLPKLGRNLTKASVIACHASGLDEMPL